MAKEECLVVAKEECHRCLVVDKEKGQQDLVMGKEEKKRPAWVSQRLVRFDKWCMYFYGFTLAQHMQLERTRGD